MPFQTCRLAASPDVLAPDGSAVRLLGCTARGSMAHFTLPPHAIAKAVCHRSVEEVWYFLSGGGRMWRCLNGREETVAVGPGLSVTIPVGARFQFRCDTHESLTAVAVTMPPWPGADEAFFVEGPWTASV